MPQSATLPINGRCCHGRNISIAGIPRGCGTIARALERSGAPPGRGGKRPPIHGAGAHCSRKNFAAARRVGCCLLAPSKITDWGAQRGGGLARGGCVRPVGVCGAAPGGADVSRISRKEKAALREAWKGEVGQSVRFRAECAFSTFKQTFGSRVAARRRESAVKEAGRKIAIHSAILEAAGEA